MSILLNNSYNDNLIHIKNKETKLHPLTKINILSKTYLNNKYNHNNKKNISKSNYLSLIIDSLIFNKNTHLVSIFKDYMIKDYIEEFLKRYYNKKESTKKIQKFPNFYRNYFKFFSSPTLRDFFSNDLLHYRFEKKAECFYKKNYKNKKLSISTEQDKGLYEDSRTSEKMNETTNSMNKSKILNTLFNEKVRNKIEKYSPVHSSMVLPENGSKLKKNGSYLLITNSNEKSLINIVNALNIKKKKKMKNNLFIDNIINNNKKRENNNNKNKYINEEKINDNINININSINFESSNSNRILQIKNKNAFCNKIRKLESCQSLKIILNNNTGLLNSNNITKRLKKSDGLWKLLKQKNEIINLNNNIFDSKSKSILSNNNPNSLSLDRIINKKNFFSNLNLNLHKKKINSSKNNNKYNSINNLNNIKIKKNAINKILINRVNSIMKIASEKQKFILKRKNRNLSNPTRNTTKNKKTELATEMFAKTNFDCGIKKFYHSPSNILDFIKISKNINNEKFLNEKNIIDNKNKILNIINKINKKYISRNENKNLEYKTLLKSFGLSSLINSKIKKENIKFNVYKLKTINHNRVVYSNKNINKMKNLEVVNHYLVSSKTINNKKI